MVYWIKGHKQSEDHLNYYHYIIIKTIITICHYKTVNLQRLAGQPGVAPMLHVGALPRSSSVF